MCRDPHLSLDRLVALALSLFLLVLCTPRVARGDDALAMWEGSVQCLDAELEPQPDPSLCDQLEDAPRFGLRTADGEWIYFQADDPQAEMFLEPRVRERRLRVVGWPRSEGEVELLSVYSLVDGVLHTIEFRCDKCSITAKGPGPCWCCKDPFEFRERPATQPHPLAAEGLTGGG